MGRNLSPTLRKELANLDKDADTRKSAMKALKSYVKDMDTKAIPLFLAQVSQTKETGSPSGEYTISLYEVLARVHGPNIVPQIDNIMSTIIKTLSSSAGSFALHQACSKVVPAIARYGIDPTTPEDKKRYIIHSLCKPLSDSLLGSQESLSSGAALCLKALVDSDNWRFASHEMVNEICLRVAGALEEKPTQTNSHMGLVMSLAKHNDLIVEAYARLLLHSGLQILNAGVVEVNSQKRLSAIQMINFLMKCLDPRSIFSELGVVIEEMEKCQSDQMAFVKGAAFEALQTARRIAGEKGSKFEKEYTGSNFSRRDCSHRRNLWNAGDQSPLTASPESQTLDSFADFDSLVESPFSTSHISHNLDYDRRSVNRKLWRYENGGVDISLKDGLFSGVSQGSPVSNMYTEHSGQDEHLNNMGHHTEEFAGFIQRTPRNGHLRSTTPSPQRTRSQSHFDDIMIFSTPRKLIRSLQDPNDVNSDFSGQKTRRFRSPSSKLEWTPTSKYDQNGFAHGGSCDVEGKKNLLNNGERVQVGSESVSSTEDVPADAANQVSHEVVPGSRAEIPRSSIEKSHRRFAFKICSLFMFVALLVSVLWIDDRDEGCNLVPT